MQAPIGSLAHTIVPRPQYCKAETVATDTVFETRSNIGNGSNGYREGASLGARMELDPKVGAAGWRRARLEVESIFGQVRYKKREAIASLKV